MSEFIPPIQNQMVALANNKGYVIHRVSEPGRMVLVLEKIDTEKNCAYTLTFVFWSEDLENPNLPVNFIDDILKQKYYSSKSYIRMKLIENLIHSVDDINNLNTIYEQILKDQTEFENIYFNNIYKTKK